MSTTIDLVGTWMPRQHLLSVEIYDSMIRSGILTENDNVELLNGAIIEKMPKGTKHAYLNDVISDFLREKFGKLAVVRNQNPIVLDDFSEPEPDIVLARPPSSRYADEHPRSSDILVVLEVSDTTLYFDRGEKALAYARAGILQYLIVNAESETVEDYREPEKDGYQSKQTYRLDDTFSLLAFPDIQISVAEFLRS